jgi:hypothetical protein
MIGSLLKAAAYSKAPKTTFAALHPKQAAHLKKLEWDMKHAYAPRVTALGVALLALPIGILLGRLTAGRGAPQGRGPRVNPNARRTGWPDEVSARAPIDGFHMEMEPARPAARDRVRTTTGTTATGTAPTTTPSMEKGRRSHRE